MLPLEWIRPYCCRSTLLEAKQIDQTGQDRSRSSAVSTSTFDLHKTFPNLFQHEWKHDDIIMNLLTVIVLFTPEEFTSNNNMKNPEEEDDADDFQKIVK